jgi:hypothetical protein
MKQYFSQFFTITLLAATAVQSFCEADLDGRISELESDMSQIRAQTAFGNYGATTASNAPQINGCGFFITADFLWWKLYEGGTEYALKDTVSVADFSLINARGPIKHLNFNWEPGYKVGLGYLFDHDGWELYLDFTSLKTRAHASTSSNVDFLFPLIGAQTFSFSKADAHWHVSFYDLDLVLGRNYFVSKYLALHPYFGLTSAWIQQHRQVTYTPPSDIAFKVRSKNNFWGIGPRLGMDSQFYLGRSFSLYGDFSGGLLWGDFHVREKEFVPSEGLNVYSLRDNLHRMVATVGFGLGIAYETNFNHDANHFMVKAGYEGQYWWRQNQMPIYNAFAIDFTRQSEDLSLQGLTVDFRLDF